MPKEGSTYQFTTSHPHRKGSRPTGLTTQERIEIESGPGPPLGHTGRVDRPHSLMVRVIALLVIKVFFALWEDLIRAHVEGLHLRPSAQITHSHMCGLFRPRHSLMYHHLSDHKSQRRSQQQEAPCQP